MFHTMLYADFLEDPVTWTLLAIGLALARAGHERTGSPVPAAGRAQSVPA